jgi:Family of unknown function (DUF6011)
MQTFSVVETITGRDPLETAHYPSLDTAIDIAALAMEGVLYDLEPLIQVSVVNELRSRAVAQWREDPKHAWEFSKDGREGQVLIFEREEELESVESPKGHPSDIVSKGFFTAGHAVFTVCSPKGEHYTFKVNKSKDDPDSDRMPVHFVALLTGPDNDVDYSYLGLYDSTKLIRMTKASKMDEGSTPVKVFRWAMRKVRDDKAGARLPEGYTIRHAGRCCRCGRTLTTPESVDSGIGPECAQKMGVPWGRWTVKPKPEPVDAPDLPVPDGTCLCGSGEQRYILYDARGISCGFVCSKCEDGRRATYKPEVFADSQYYADEPIEPEG